MTIENTSVNLTNINIFGQITQHWRVLKTR